MVETYPRASSGFGGDIHTDGIDYKIHGADMQFVELELDPHETVISEAGALMYKDAAVEMRSLFGDGSDKNSGFFGRISGMAKRVLTGESLFVTTYTNESNAKASLALAAPYPGHIYPIDLKNYDGCIICQKDSFLGAAKGVSLGIHFQKKIMMGLFGGEGFIMQKLEGDGFCFIHMGGTIVERELKEGEILHVDTGCLAAMTPSVEMNVIRSGGIKNILFSGEGLFMAEVKGPGRVWLQSLPFSRLAMRMMQAAPQWGNKNVGES